MPGYLHDLALLTEYSFPGLAATASQDIPVAVAVDISAFPEATLEVRLHEKTITASSGAKIEVLALAALPSAQDPNRRFLDKSTAGTLASVEVTDSVASIDTPPLLLRDPLPANAGAFATVVVRGTTSGTLAANLKATLSLSLSLKS